MSCSHPEPLHASGAVAVPKHGLSSDDSAELELIARGSFKRRLSIDIPIRDSGCRWATTASLKVPSDVVSVTLLV